MKSKKSIIILSMLTMFIVPLLVGMRSNAAQSSIIELKDGKTYKSYDITGDAVPDKIFIKASSTTLSIRINDVPYNWNWADEIDNFSNDMYSHIYVYKTRIYLYSLSNGNKYLDISTKGDTDDKTFHTIYKYTSGNFTKALDVKKTFIGAMAGMGHDATPLKINGNTITMKYSTGVTASANYDFNVRYKATGNKFKPIDKKYKITKFIKAYGVKTIRVLKSFKIYKQAGGKKVAFKTKPGEKLKALQICPKGRKAYVLLQRSNKKKGWVNLDFKYGTIDNM